MALIDEVLASVDAIRRAAPIATRMECGPGVVAYLKRTLHSSGPVFTGLPFVACGIQVYEDDDMDSGAWRIIDSRGDVMHEGMLR